jgi:hypothetical protein
MAILVYVKTNTNSGTTYCITIRIMLQQKHGVLSPLHTICISWAVFEVYLLSLRFHRWRQTQNKRHLEVHDGSTCKVDLFREEVNIFFLMVRQLLAGQGLPSVEASRSRSDTQQSVGLLWTSDQPNAEISTWQHTTLTRDIDPCRRRDSNLQPQQASSRTPTP